MNPVSFTQQTHVIGKGQPQYVPLPAHVDETQPEVPFTFCFELDESEIAELVQTKKLTFNKGFQPIRLSTRNPFEDVVIFSPGFAPDEVKKRLPEHLFRLIHEQVGAASMCWEAVHDAGEFKSEKASEVAKTICDAVEAELNK